jgi:hypothetical protein
VRPLAIAIATALSLVACGGADKSAAGRKIPAAPRISRDLDPTDVLPADLDLVVRLDIARLRSGIGGVAANVLASQAARAGVDPELREAMACADVVWIATRAAEIEAGDRVIVVEGKSCMPELARSRWGKVRSGNGRLLIFDRKGPVSRVETARIMNLGNRATAFVSPVELDSVKRVLDTGPDAQRGNPRAEGLLSADVRPRPLSPRLAKKYPSIASVLSGIERVRGTAVLVDEGLKVDAEVLARSPAAAQKASKFLDAVRKSLEEGRFAEVVKGAKVETVDKTVQLKLTVPKKLLLAAMGAGN